MTNTDLTFITNENGQNLLERFKVLIGDNTQFFDCLVGYFFTSGFYKLYPSLETTDKIRILIGLKTDQKAFDMMEQAKQQTLAAFSHAEAKDQFSSEVAQEMENSEDSHNVEEGVQKFIDWIKNKKLEVRAYPSQNLHAKVYIMSFGEGDRDQGRVVTGSSNFSASGLVDNFEFNVELKNAADYNFALKKFNDLWENSVDVSENYVDTINTQTWLNNTVTPYELYLKFLYEYFRADLSQQEDASSLYHPESFLQLEYQDQAVTNAKRILEEYGGVFISDVVGLGKTYISAMLASQLDGRTLVIAPPVLLDKSNPGSWPNVFSDFRVPADYESHGKLEDMAAEGTDKYKNVIIDEAHRFRSESNVTYENLAQICRGKRVILVTATPLNNSPKDILSQIKLFQKGKQSTIPNIADLDGFFGRLEGRLRGLDRQKDYDTYMNVIRENARDIREKVLKYLMVRRTRNEVLKYYGEDLTRQKLKFPEVADPEPIFYQLDENEDKVFIQTIQLISQEFSYARYRPMMFYKGDVTHAEKLGQENMGKFMKILLIKRLESSFYAFKLTLQRFLNTYEQFINEFDSGNVYISKKYSSKVFEFLENDDDEAIQRLIDNDRAQQYKAQDFDPQFRQLLEKDIQTLRRVIALWQTVERDPKFLAFKHILNTKPVLKDNKLIVFTESKETADYLDKNLSKIYPGQILSFSGSSGSAMREKIIENFDAKVRHPKDDYRILVTTEVLAEGVNLHRANVVINYDLPWNPTRIIQRVGRVNRVNTKFDTIHTFNFFPTQQSNDQIKLREAAEAKIQAFIEMLGADAKLLTEGEEIKSHDLFASLISKETITGEGGNEESELKYLKVIRDIRDDDPELFTTIKRLPKKSRTARAATKDENAGVLTYLRRGKLEKFYLASTNKSEELDFFNAARTLECAPETARAKLDARFYELLELNKHSFTLSTTEELQESARGGRDSSMTVLSYLKAIKNFQGFTEDDEEYIKSVIRLLNQGALPKQTTKTLARDLQNEANPLKILGIIKTIPADFFKDTLAENTVSTHGPREVILSEYLTD